MSSDKELDKEVEIMCNLGQGIVEESMAKGLTKGREEGLMEGRIEQNKKIAFKMYQRGDKLEDIAFILDVTQEQVKEWVLGPVMV